MGKDSKASCYSWGKNLFQPGRVSPARIENHATFYAECGGGYPRRIPQLTMKKLLLALLCLAGLSTLAPQAEAGGYRERYSRSYDHHRYSTRHYSYRDHCAPRYYTYHRPVRYYRSYDYCAPRYYSYSRPRVSFHFGF